MISSDKPERIDPPFHKYGIKAPSESRRTATAFGLLAHLMAEIQKSQEREDTRPEWVDLELAIAESLSALGTGDIDRICKSFFELGHFTHSLEGESPLEEQELREHAAQGRASRKALGSVNIKKQIAKSYALRYADAEWAKDDKEEIRIGEMAQIVWSHMFGLDNQVLKDSLPDKPDSLKSWIRPLTETYTHAKRRGPNKMK